MSASATVCLSHYLTRCQPAEMTDAGSMQYSMLLLHCLATLEVLLNVLLLSKHGCGANTTQMKRNGMITEPQDRAHLRPIACELIQIRDNTAQP